MSETEQRDMLIRHDEQLRALALLPAAVTELTAQLREANARNHAISAAIGIAGSVIGTIGTWFFMAKR